jgi:hypothetical protein
MAVALPPADGDLGEDGADAGHDRGRAREPDDRAHVGRRKVVEPRSETTKRFTIGRGAPEPLGKTYNRRYMR